MSERKPHINLYTIGGAVQAGGGVYLPRAADDELLALCREGNFSYVLTPRQMGKTSLMVRTAERIGEEGIQSVIIDLTQIGVQVTVEAWYLGLLTSIEDQLMLSTNAVEWWEARKHQGLTQRLAEFFKDVLLKEVEGRVVVFVDEIDTTLSLTFTDDFYAAIRYFFNARAHTPELKRLSFVLIGVATPSDLVRDPQRTPFNIGHRVDLTDFTADEALPLADGLGLPAEESRRVLGWVMEWTGGHPYLTQRLCRAVAEEKRESWSRDDVERLTGSVFFGEMSEKDHNLQFVRDMLTKRAPDLVAVLTTYREVLRGRRPVPDEEQSIAKSHLKLSGVVYRKQGFLHVRNPIYKKVFDDYWVGEHLPINWMKRLQRIAAALALLILVGLIPLSIYAINRARTAEKQTALALTQSKLAEERRREAENERAKALEARQVAETERANAEKQRMNAETAAEKEKIARADAEKQRAVAEEQRRRAESAAGEARRQAALARESQQQAEAARAEADNLRKLAFSGQLGALAESTGDLQRSALIARESILQSPEAPPLIAYQALIRALMLLPLPVKEFPVGEPVMRQALSPDRKYLVTMNYGPQVEETTGTYIIKVFDFNQGYKEIPELARDVLMKETRFDSALTHLATVHDGKVSIVELTTGRRTSFEARGSGKEFALSPGGKYFAYIDEENQMIHLRDVPGGKELDSWKTEGVSRISGFSSTGKYLLTLLSTQSTKDGGPYTLTVRDIAAKRDVKKFPESFDDWLLFSPDDQYWLEKRADDDMVIKRTSDFEEVVATVKNSRNVNLNNAESATTTFSPDSKLLAFADDQNTLRVLKVEGGEVDSSFRPGGMMVSDITFSPDGKYLAVTYVGNMAQVWALESNAEVTRIMSKGLFNTTEFGPDGKLVTTDNAGGIQVWDTQNDLDFVHRSVGEGGERTILTPDGRYFAEKHSGNFFYLKVSDTTTSGKGPLASIEYPSVGAGAALSPDGKYAAASVGNGLRIWEVGSEQAPREIKSDYLAEDIAISAGGKYVAIIIHGKPDSKVQVWEVATGKLIATIEHKDDAHQLVFSPDGEYLASGGQTIQLLRLADRKQLEPITFERDEVKAMAFSPKGKYLAMGSSELKVWVHDTGQVVTLTHSEAFIESIAFSRDERYMATSRYDIAQVWDVAAELKAAKHEGMASFDHDNSRIFALALTGNGDHLVTINQNSYARVWDVRNRREIARVPYQGSYNGKEKVAFIGENDKYFVTTHFGNPAEVWLWRPDDLVQMSCSRLTLEKTSDIPWKDYLDEQLLKNLHFLGDCPAGK